MSLSGKKIAFGITASFCTVQDILEPLRLLAATGADIYPVVSPDVFANSSRFHNRDEFLAEISKICGRDIISTTKAAEPMGPKNPMDIMIIAPATGNTIAKIAAGIWDNGLLTAAKAALRNGRPLVLAIFTNDALSQNGVNIMRLYNTKNIYFVPFGQDDPAAKPTSMAADLSQIQPTLLAALSGKQIQPAIIAPPH